MLVSQGHDPISFNQGIRAAVTWLHRRAEEMNDPHARAILNSAAWHLGKSALKPADTPSDVTEADTGRNT